MINNVENNNDHINLQKDVHWYSIDSIRFENKLAKWKNSIVKFLQSPLSDPLVKKILYPAVLLRSKVVMVSKRFLRKQLFKKQRSAEPSPYLTEMKKEESALPTE